MGFEAGAAAYRRGVRWLLAAAVLGCTVTAVASPKGFALRAAAAVVGALAAFLLAAPPLLAAAARRRAAAGLVEDAHPARRG